MRRPSILLALLITASVSHGQDALRGKRLYLDTPRIVGSTAACVDCHGGLPGGAFGIGRAANDPDAVERAVNAIPPMAIFRGRLFTQDFADLAAFIGNPAVASPDLRLTTTAPAGGSSSSSAIDFGVIPVGQSSAIASVRVTNVGQVQLLLTSAPRLRGVDSADFSILATDCTVPATLLAQESCRIDLAFRPQLGSGPRAAALQIDHDWVEGTAALAVLGTAGRAAPPAADPSAGGGGALGTTGAVSAIVLVLATVLRRRRPDTTALGLQAPGQRRFRTQPCGPSPIEWPELRSAAEGASQGDAEGDTCR